jgi:hypothetical protein
MKKFFTAALLLCSVISKAQTFTWNGILPIVSNTMDTLYIPVSGLPNTIDFNFGISKVCFNATHTNKKSLTLILVSPSSNSVILVEGQGAGSESFTGTCVGMDGIPFQAGTPPYTGTFLPTGNLSNFNSGINPNGDWMLIAFDNTPDTGSLTFASITFSNNPPQGNGLGGGNLGPQGPFIRPGLVCPDGVSGCELLPDVTASALEIQTSWVETPGRIEVGNSTPNIGYGPLEIFGIDSCFCNGVPAPCNTPCPTGQNLTHVIRQRIYRKLPGTDTLGFYDRDAGQMTYHPEHRHLHVDHWADFTLRTATSDPDPRNWPIIGTSVKQSYCLVNLASCPNRAGICVDNNGNNITNFPNYNFGFYSGCGMNQGIYPGQYDIYSRGLNEPILLDNVCNGNYYIVSITDPNNIFLESDETNNVAVVPITLTRQQSIPTIQSNSPYLCGNGDSIVLTSSTASSYLWSTGDTTRSIVVRDTGMYTVSIPCGISLPFHVTNLPPDILPAVSIAITNGSLPSCPGNKIDFKATPVNGGNSPTYQWKVDGVNAGSNSDTFTLVASTNGQVVSCALSSSITCLAGQVPPADSITILVPPVNSFEAVVTQTKGHNPFCPGDTVTFKADAVVGYNPSYQWKADGINVGSNAPEFTSSSLQAGQIITCAITAMPGCGNDAKIGAEGIFNQPNSTTGAAYPTYYGNGHQQYLIRATELTDQGFTSGTFTRLGFITGSNVGNPAMLREYTIRIAQVSNTFLTGTMLNPSFTTLFGPYDFVPAINSINYHNFTSPFNWDGTSNLLLDICFSSDVYGEGSYQTRTSTTPFVSTTRYQRDYSVFAPCDSITGFTSSTRPHMLLSKITETEITSAPITLERLEPVYHFTGTGNWDLPANWLNGKKPPTHVLHCAEIIIDPAGNGECILNTKQVVSPGARITVVTGKKFRIIGDVLVQE